MFFLVLKMFQIHPFKHDCPPQCDLVLDAAHRKSLDLSIPPRKEDIVDSIIFKATDAVAVTFKDVDLNFAKKGKDIFLCESIYFLVAPRAVLMLVVPVL